MNAILILHVKHDTSPRVPPIGYVKRSRVHRVAEVRAHERLHDVVLRSVGHDRENPGDLQIRRAVFLKRTFYTPRPRLFVVVVVKVDDVSCIADLTSIGCRVRAVDENVLNNDVPRCVSRTAIDGPNHVLTADRCGVSSDLQAFLPSARKGLQITGSTATVGGKNLVRSVNGAAASSAGDVTVHSYVVDGVKALGGADYNEIILPGFYHVNSTGSTNGPGYAAKLIVLSSKTGESVLTQVVFPIFEGDGSASVHPKYLG